MSRTAMLKELPARIDRPAGRRSTWANADAAARNRNGVHHAFCSFLDGGGPLCAVRVEYGLRRSWAGIHGFGCVVAVRAFQTGACEPAAPGLVCQIDPARRFRR